MSTSEDIVVSVLGGIVLCTYVGLVVALWLFDFPLKLAWGGLARWSFRWVWALTTFGSVIAFFHLWWAVFSTGAARDKRFPLWVWLWFLISAMAWVPLLLVDWKRDTRFARLAVWSTAGATVVIFVQSFDRDLVTTLVALWFMVHHVIMDGIVWVSPPPDKVLPSSEDRNTLQFQPVANDGI